MLISLFILVIAPMTCSVTVAEATLTEYQQCADSGNSLKE